MLYGALETEPAVTVLTFGLGPGVQGAAMVPHWVVETPGPQVLLPGVAPNHVHPLAALVSLPCYRN